jgi:hypothetical protein
MSKASVSPVNLVLLTVAACALLSLPALADSQARIVRLSDVQGTVQIDKNTGIGFENAFLNLPITQGTQVKTLDRGRAEIEFEDGSTMRLTPNSTLQFSTLAVDDSGKHISVVNLVDGMAYVNWIGKSGDEFTVNFSHEKIALSQGAHFRVDTSAHAPSLAVFKGDVQVESPSGNITVSKNKTAAFDASDDKATLANKVEETPFDSWDKEAISYHDQYARNNNTSSPYGYGLSDLNYYGSYANVPGYGMMWQPFFTGVGWDPFMDGAWGFYPGFGYMFASAYPWGWLPYRYGNWNFISGRGWMWQPGGWNTWLTMPHYAGRMPTNFHPLVPPTVGTVKTVAVGRGGTVPTATTPRMVLRAGSAGLGIQRGSLDNLRHMDHQVAKNGFAEVRPAPQFSTSSSRTSPGFSAPRSGPAPMSAPLSRGSSAGHSSAGASHH